MENFMSTRPAVSIIIVSFNTCDLLQECLRTLYQQLTDEAISHEVIVVDNHSRDESIVMVKKHFPDVITIANTENKGFAAANNQGYQRASGEFIVLLNSDAFPHQGAFSRSIELMRADKNIGLAGAQLVGKDGAWQPSARQFPSLLNHFLTLSGLAAKFPHSRFFGRVDRTWADVNQSSVVDWVPGAFSIIRRDVLEKLGFFDEVFFLYYEEVDLCRRIQAAGYSIHYFADVKVIHLGGESSKTLSLSISDTGTQIMLWQLRSTLLYYRKHYGGLVTWLWLQLEKRWHQLRAWKNKRHAENAEKAAYSDEILRLLEQAWTETQGGKISPPRPW